MESIRKDIMVDLWMPGAEKRSIGNFGDMEGGPSRATHHTTSNPNNWDFGDHVGYFTGGGAGVAPHLLADPFTGEVAQFFPANSRALALRNAGDIRTNRTGEYNIQIEWVFTKGEVVGGKTYDSLAETPMKPLPQIMDWLRSLGIVDRWAGGKPVAWSRDTVSTSTWTGIGGHYGHNQVPGNDHVDPGPMPDIFRDAGGSAPKPTPVYAPHPGASFFRLGRRHPLITELGRACVRAGYKGYRQGPGPTFTLADKRAVTWFQKKQGWTGSDADGIPGPETWKRLKVARPKN